MNTDDLLSFKEYQPVHESYAIGGSAEININSPKKNTPYGDDHLQGLINDMSASVQVLNKNDSNIQQNSPPGDDKPPVYSFFSIEYYQQYFNVDTTMVLDRIACAMIPKRAATNYLKQQIGLNPDLYGPFWIVVTLIFAIAISGNLASYLQNANSNYHWRYNFHLVSIAATTIIMYVCFVPLALWAAFKWFVRPADADFESEVSLYTPTLLTLICIYGYSLGVYIPVCILWVIQVSFLQWLLVISATFLSGSVLVLVLTPALRDSRGALILAAGIVTAHFLLAAGFMLYFFHVPDVIIPAIINEVKNATA